MGYLDDRTDEEFYKQLSDWINLDIQDALKNYSLKDYFYENPYWRN